MTQNFIPLSESPQGGIFDGTTAEPTRTVLHSIPDGETHRVMIRCNNTHSSAAIRVVGDYKGGASDQTYAIDEEGIAARTSRTIVDTVLDGPCTVEVSAVSQNTVVNFYGYAEVIRRK